MFSLLPKKRKIDVVYMYPKKDETVASQIKGLLNQPGVSLVSLSFMSAEHHGHDFTYAIVVYKK